MYLVIFLLCFFPNYVVLILYTSVLITTILCLFFVYTCDIFLNCLLKVTAPTNGNHANGSSEENGKKKHKKHKKSSRLDRIVS